MEEKNCRVAETDKRNPGQPLSKVSLSDIDLSKLPPRHTDSSRGTINDNRYSRRRA